MNWDDPVERLHLIERVGPTEYNRQMQEHHRDSTLATVNGYAIRPVGSRFGQIFMISGTERGYPTLEEAKAYAATLPQRERA